MAKLDATKREPREKKTSAPSIPKEESSSATPPASTPAPLTEQATNVPIGKRVSFKVSDSNVIDFEGMRDASKKQLRDALAATLRTPEGKAALGFNAEETAALKPFTDSDSVKLWMVLSNLNIQIFSSKLLPVGYRVDSDIAVQAFGMFSLQQNREGAWEIKPKPGCDSVVQPTTSVLNKHADRFQGMLKYKDELELAGAVVFMLKAQMELARDLQQKKNDELAEAAKGSPQQVNGVPVQ